MAIARFDADLDYAYRGEKDAYQASAEKCYYADLLTAWHLQVGHETNRKEHDCAPD